MAGTAGGMRNWKARVIWLWVAVVVLVVIATSIIFAILHKPGNSRPGEVSPGNAELKSGVLVNDNCGSGEGVSEPATIQLTCGDGTIVANNVIWSQWATTKALGQGSLNEVSCIPNCASGKDVAYKAQLTLSEPVKAGSGKEYFTRIAVSFIGKSPNGSSSQLFKDCFDTPPAPYLPACPADEQGAN